MTRGLNNWTFHDVAKFLKNNDFKLNNIAGSHHFYVGMVGGKFRQVCVPFHSSHAIKPRTLKGIILQSGISKDEWKK